MTLDDLLKATVTHEASDLLLKAGAKPALRVHGRVGSLSAEPLTPEFTQQAMAEITTERQRQTFEREGEVDLSHDAPDIGRFRVNVYKQRGLVGLVFRHVKREISSLQELNLPQETLIKFCSHSRGLLLVTGVTGCGKSTTLAALVEHINQTQHKHIVTIEDPIEFLYEDKKSLVEQREIWEDTMSFGSAMRHVVRQAPDVILIGEMRDQETMAAALNAAETGHLVLSTLHTVNVSQTVERIINFFPQHQHDLIRLQLSMILVGAASLRLVPRADGKGRVPAVEILTGSPRVRELLHDGRTVDLYQAIREGGFFGMQTFNQSLKQWVEKGVVKLEDAMAAADDPDELRLELEGVTGASQRGEIVLE